MSFSGAITAIKTAISGAATPALTETPHPLRDGLTLASRPNFDRSYFLGIETDGRPDEHGIQPGGQERAECRLSVQLGAALQADRNDDQSELQVIAQQVVESLLMLQDSNVVFLRTEERPVLTQDDRRLVWAQVWLLTYRI